MQDEKPKQPDTSPARRNRTAPVARDAAEIGAGVFARAGFRNPSLVLRWAEIAGPDVARVAQPVRLSEGPGGGILVLKAEPGASLFLQHESRMLCERVNAYLGYQAVSRLRFVQGPLPSPGRGKHRRPIATKVAPDDPALSYDGPEGLKSALIKLAKARQRPD